MKLVSAIVRTGRLERVEDALIEMGVPDITVSKVSGFAGRRLLDRKELTPHMRVDVVIPGNQADRVAECICEAACTGLPGDGIVVVMPVEKVVKIKTRRYRPAAPEAAESGS